MRIRSGTQKKRSIVATTELFVGSWGQGENAGELKAMRSRVDLELLRSAVSQLCPIQECSRQEELISRLKRCFCDLS
jgi:hypothetical protein